MSVFPFVEAEKAEQHNVAKACALLEVSRSAFYEWHKHIPSAREVADEELGAQIERIDDDSKGTYGWPRVHRTLRREACAGAGSGSLGSCAGGAWSARAVAGGRRPRSPTRR